MDIIFYCKTRTASASLPAAEKSANPTGLTAHLRQYQKVRPAQTVDKGRLIRAMTRGFRYHKTTFHKPLGPGDINICTANDQADAFALQPFGNRLGGLRLAGRRVGRR